MDGSWADHPVTNTEFAGLMAALGPWDGGRRVAVAVSGGADSLCLALLASRWGRPLALVVDHGLRAGSAAEAALTATRLAAMGVAHRVLTLRVAAGPAIAARARRARYAALADAALAAGLADLLVGHHALDQAETVRLRQIAHSGEAGLAGMAWIVEHAAWRLVRPLLGVAPSRLRATLQAAGIGWVEDPSNADRTAARGALRWAMADPHANAPATRALLAQAAACGAARAQRDRQVADILAQQACIRPEGFVYLTPGPVDADALAALIRAVTGAAYPPSANQVRPLAAQPRAATLGGARLLPAGRLGPGWLIVRETAALAAIPAVHGAVWDRRFRLHLTAAWPGLRCQAVGDAARQLRRASDLPAVVLSSLPGLWMQDTLVAVPAIGYDKTCREDGWSVQTVFSPAVPAAGAAFHV